MHRFPTGRVFATLVLAALLEPLGHSAAYALRYGPAQAWQIQSQGSHAAFPRVFTLSVLSVGVALALGLMAVLAIRLILGNRRVFAAGWWSTFLMLAITQGTLFVVKEVVEAFAVRLTPDLLAIAILVVVAQLPLAALAAWLISWIRAYLALGPEAIRAVLAVRLAPPRTHYLAHPITVPAPVGSLRDRRCYRRRGPPLSH